MTLTAGVNDIEAETPDERCGNVPRVVSSTAIEEIEGKHDVFYGVANSKIGVARLDHVTA